MRVPGSAVAVGLLSVSTAAHDGTARSAQAACCASEDVDSRNCEQYLGKTWCCTAADIKGADCYMDTESTEFDLDAAEFTKCDTSAAGDDQVRCYVDLASLDPSKAAPELEAGDLRRSQRHKRDGDNDSDSDSDDDDGDNDGSSSGISGGAIAGIAVGGVAAVAAIGGCTWWRKRKQKKKKKKQKKRQRRSSEDSDNEQNRDNRV